MRRREPDRPAASSAPVPLWVRNLGAGLRHVNGRSLMDSITTDNLSRDRALLREAKARWCAENGCHRQGKPCREVYGHVPEDCRKAGGPAGEGEGRGMAEVREQLTEVDRGMA